MQDVVDRWRGYTRDVERILGSLPLDLLDLAPLRLYLGSAPRADAEDVLDYFLPRAPYGPPVIECATWLLDDLGVTDARVHEDLERAAYIANVLYCLAATLAEWVAERSVAAEHALLIPILQHQGDVHLAMIADDRARLDEASVAFAERAQSSLAYRKAERGQGSVAAMLLKAADFRHAYVKAPLAAIARSLGRPELVDPLSEIVSALHGTCQVHAEIVGIRSDLERGALTYPIACIAADAGIDLGCTGSKSELLGAAVVTPSVPRMLRACSARLAIAAERAETLGLVAFARGVREREPALRTLLGITQLQSLFANVEGKGEVENRERTLRRATERGTAFLKADPTFREAFEVHRWGLFGVAELTGSLFPTGLVLEHTAQLGIDVAASSAALVERYARNGCHYFDEPSPMPPDIDTLGLMLRLVRVVERPSELHAALAPVLAWLERSIEPDGHVPVWLVHGPAWEMPAHIIGRSCSSCVAGLLVGLLGFDAERYRALVARAASALVSEVAITLAGSSSFYGSAYLTFVLAELETELVQHEALTSIATELGAVVDTLQRADETRLWRSPQDDALMILTYLARAPEKRLPIGLVSDAAERIVAAQQDNGSFPAVPIYGAPIGPDRSGWFASRLITTALCTRALFSLDQYLESRMSRAEPMYEASLAG